MSRGERLIQDRSEGYDGPTSAVVASCGFAMKIKIFVAKQTSCWDSHDEGMLCVPPALSLPLREGSSG